MAAEGDWHLHALQLFIGAGSAAVNAWSHGAVTNVGISLAFGSIILVAVYSLGHISGAHLNPAVTTSAFGSRGAFPLAT